LVFEMSYESGGQEFESLRARQLSFKNQVFTLAPFGSPIARGAGRLCVVFLFVRQRPGASSLSMHQFSSFVF
jgi:hypothetical protein